MTLTNLSPWSSRVIQTNQIFPKLIKSNNYMNNTKWDNTYSNIKETVKIIRMMHILHVTFVLKPIFPNNLLILRISGLGGRPVNI